MNQKLYFLMYILFINLLSFFIMGYDKNLAKGHKRRVSEKTLFSLALFLGSIGIYSGMFKFRHKTKHYSFLVLIPIIFVINIITSYYIYKLL